KPAGQVLVGFAAETSDLVANATGKLHRKNLDLVVANDVSAPGVGFQHETNAVTLLRADGTQTSVPLSDKRAIAAAVLDSVYEIHQAVATADTSIRRSTP
ncbi:MAG: phosphopantothenoylcysteine decarboxylase, partial [Actinomycetota bacterium]